MLPDGRLTPLLFRHLHYFVPAPGDDFVETIRRAMKLLRAEHQIHVRQPVNQFLSPALRHATHEAEHHLGAVAADFRGEVLHFPEGLLFREVTHTARVEQNHVRPGFGRHEGVTLGHKLRGDGLAVALVHLATVGFDVNTRHGTTIAAI
jgi:hypothetical protein